MKAFQRWRKINWSNFWRKKKKENFKSSLNLGKNIGDRVKENWAFIQKQQRSDGWWKRKLKNKDFIYLDFMKKLLGWHSYSDKAGNLYQKMDINMNFKKKGEDWIYKLDFKKWCCWGRLYSDIPGLWMIWPLLFPCISFCKKNKI